MSFSVLRKRHKESWAKVAKVEHTMGLDPMLFIPTIARKQRPDHPDLRGLPIRFQPDVRTKEIHEEVEGDFGILHKEYSTPSGKLSTTVNLSKDWPHGDHIPFVDDYQVPRSQKPLISEEEDLKSLQHLLIPPQDIDIAQFNKEVRKARVFVEKHNILLAGGWGVGMDMANWLCGIQNLTIMLMEKPEFVIDLLEMIHIWNKQRMEVALSAPVDLYIRRAWYEGCDFVTPRFYQSAVLPRLKVEVDLAHENGAKFGYICSSGTKPMLDFYLEAGIDVLIGIDPIQGTYTDMPLMSKKLNKHICIWGGVSGAITVERGTEEDVRSAVQRAIKTLGPDGFILSPVDNITIDEPLTWQNIDFFIDEWRKHW